MTDQAIAAARAVIERGLADRAFPAAVVNVGTRAGVVWRQAFGRLSYADQAPPCQLETMFDLASLTKVIATASLTMRHVARGLSIETPVAEFIDNWRDDDRARVTIRQLLDHSSGLPARVLVWQLADSRAAAESVITATALERAPGSSAVYSDVGFMLLGLVLERIGSAPLDRQLRDLFGSAIDPIQFRPLAQLYERIAPTEFDPWRGRVLCGEVHDENAAMLGGVAGHAGLFGTADAVGAFARIVLQTFHTPTVLGSPDVMRIFAARSTVRGSSRALAWDTALPTSSSGTKMTPTAIGHTGFTGTSFWIDSERDFYAVLLTNRVHPTRANQKLVPLRGQFHDALLAIGPG
jgi:CubicO group peptidase (beta-lactamase class C family)